MRPLLEDAAARAIRYIEALPSRRVAPAPEAVARLNELEHPLPGEPTDPAEVLRRLDELGSPAAMGTAGPRFFGFVTGGALPATVAANWMCTAWDQPLARYSAEPGGSVIEEVAANWCLNLLGLPPGAGTAFVTGATMANFTALAVARDTLLRRAGWDAIARGLYGAPEITVVAGEEAHPSVLKALGMLGLGRERVVRVPVDNQGRMLAAALPNLPDPAILCLQLGNVNTGACDPVSDLIPKARAAGAWVHIDGAFGLWAAACPEKAHLVAGAGEADSWATDAHKWLNVPYDCGIAFVREASGLLASMSMRASYLPISDHRDPADYVPELSRRARGVDVWASLLSLGRDGLAGLIRRNCAQARRFADGLRAAGHEILNEVVLNQVLVSFGEPERTLRIVRDIQDEGTCWCGSTVWQGRTAMRISVSSWATTDGDVDRSLEAILRIAAK